MKQFIVKVPGSEYELDKVLGLIMGFECPIVSISITGGGFMGGSPITYVIVEGLNPGIEVACADYIPSYEKKYEMPIIDSLFNKNEIDKKEYDKRVDKLRKPIKGVEVIEPQY